MATTNINIRVDSDVKAEASRLFSSLGPAMTAAINVFLQQAIRHRGFPFPTTAEPSETRRKPVKLGLLRGKIQIADDFDAPLEDFKEYMYRKTSFFTVCLFASLLLSACSNQVLPRWVGELPDFVDSERKSALQNPRLWLNEVWDERAALSFIGADKKIITINTCNDFIKAYQAEEELDHPSEHNLFAWFACNCYAVKIFSDAKPSRVSYIKDFLLTKETVLQLPPLLGFVFHNEQIEESRKFKTLGEFRRGYVEEVSKYSATLYGFYDDPEEGEEEHFRQTFYLLAKGDFTGDGIEDMLIATYGTPTGGSMQLHDLFIVSKITADGDFVATDGSIPWK